MRVTLSLVPTLVLVGLLIIIYGPGSDPGVTGDPVDDLDTQPEEPDFRRLGAPRPGSWRDLFGEEHQSFEEYVRSNPVRAEEGCEALAFIPVGAFDDDRREDLDATIRFAGIWFDLPTRTLPAEDLPESGHHRDRDFSWAGGSVRQYHTDWFLRTLLPRLVPEDAIALTAVTMADLYPDEDWNYVFGQATFARRVAVYSLVRHFEGFWGEEPTASGERLGLQRSLKLVVHELGHCFGLRHCVEYECTMNGSNSLRESDQQPLHLCPGCLRKLSWNRGFDLLSRYRRLETFYREHGLEDEAHWVGARLAHDATSRPLDPRSGNSR